MMLMLYIREEALAAVQEAIRMAQEANDHVCLQHALVSYLLFITKQVTCSLGYGMFSQSEIKELSVVLGLECLEKSEIKELSTALGMECLANQKLNGLTFSGN